MNTTTSTDLQPLPFFFIGQSLSTARIGSYQDQKLGLLSKAIDKPDTESIWYSREHIQKLLDEIDYAQGDGVRMYFGSYEATHEYAGQTCIVMNATRSYQLGDTTVHVDVVLEKEPDFDERSSIPRSYIIFPGDENRPFKRDFNYGSPCPPRCDPPPSDFDQQP